MKPYITVLVPNYNEIENVKRGVLSDIVNYLKKQKYTWEILISDDGSTDASLLVIKEFVRQKQKCTSLSTINTQASHMH
jgi:Glycosyltransferases involved in cell wall biogenesis